MNDDRLRGLMNGTADSIEPGDRLDAIRSATSGGRRTGRGWWAVGGAGLVAASLLTAFALTSDSTSRSNNPGPAASPSSPTSSETFTVRCQRCSPHSNDDTTSTIAVYYVDDTPDGPRLAREFRRVEGDPLDSAVSAAVGSDPDGQPTRPLDPDYRVPWPPLTSASATLSTEGDIIEISLGGDPEGSLRDRSIGLPVEADLAVEQVIRTAQAAVGERLPVRFLLYGEITDQVLGVPTSETLTAGSDLALLSHVSLTTPASFATVDND